MTGGRFIALCVNEGLKVTRLEGKPSEMPEYVPEAGEIVWLELSPQAGHEQAGTGSVAGNL